MAVCKVVYLLGFGRSGSTIVGNVLGEQPGFFHAGELSYFWETALSMPRTCGCGELVPSCPFWRDVLDGLDFGELVGWSEVARLQQRLLGRHSRAYREVIERFYRRILEVAGARRVLVDSSKNPRYGALLATLPSLDVRFVHLVRDPRATVYSRQRAALINNGSRGLPRKGVLVADALTWTRRNLAAEIVTRRTRSIRVRHDDFVSNPRGTVAAILQAVDEEEQPAGFSSPTSVTLTPNHTCGGNRIRYNSGVTEITYDGNWTAALSEVDLGLVTIATLPLLGRYGFPYRINR